MAEATPLLELEGVSKHFPVRTGAFRKTPLKAVDGVDLRLMPGDSLGLVGESGSGKSTVARLITGLHQSTGGALRFEGQEVGQAGRAERRRLSRQIQMVFQDPHASLNPRRTILQNVAEPLEIHTDLGGTTLRRRVQSLLETVGLGRGFLYRYPHELSGGQKQRVCIARAVALEPRLVVLDEPTSALDVSVQAQILEFLKELQARLDLTYLFISHNLAVVRYLCARVSVMYLGRIVEAGRTARVFDSPKHPYTEVLIRSVPRPRAEQEATAPLEGDIPSPLAMPSGCPFHTRCPKKIGRVCEEIVPRPRPLADGTLVSCHLHHDPETFEDDHGRVAVSG